eukprot:ANDGO_02793.mRNA.1 hypothetical protein
MPVSFPLLYRRTTARSDDIIAALRKQLPATRNPKRARAELEREEQAVGLYKHRPTPVASSSSSGLLPSFSNTHPNAVAVPLPSPTPSPSSVSSSSIADPPAKRRGFVPREPCKFFFSGNCHKGDNCTYSHQLHFFPCPHFHLRGSCPDGARCKHSHSPISDSQKSKLMEKYAFTAPTSGSSQLHSQASAHTTMLSGPHSSIFMDAINNANGLLYGSARLVLPHSPYNSNSGTAGQSVTAESLYTNTNVMPTPTSSVAAGAPGALQTFSATINTRSMYC